MTFLGNKPTFNKQKKGEVLNTYYSRINCKITKILTKHLEIIISSSLYMKFGSHTQTNNEQNKTFLIIIGSILIVLNH